MRKHKTLCLKWCFVLAFVLVGSLAMAHGEAILEKAPPLVTEAPEKAATLAQMRPYLSESQTACRKRLKNAEVCACVVRSIQDLKSLSLAKMSVHYYRFAVPKGHVLDPSEEYLDQAQSNCLANPKWRTQGEAP